MTKDLKSICFEKHMKGKSYLLSSGDSIKENFDVMIFSCGWELRCTEIVNYFKGNAKNVLILSFIKDDVEGYEPEYMEKLVTFSKEIVKDKDNDIQYIENNPFELDKISKQIIEYFHKIIKNENRQIRIGFDISSCPRYFFLYLLGLCINFDLIEEISFFYSEGRYEKEKEQFIHTAGKWNLTVIPGYEGLHNPEGMKFFITSAGFEGKKYRSIISQKEPQKLALLLPIPGYHSGYTKQVNSESRDLINDYNVLPEFIFKARAGDAISAWNELKKSEINPDHDNITYLTFGPKPHVLAMGLHALMNNKISVLYRVSQGGYTRMNVKPTGKFWIYNIRNLSVI